MADERKRLLFEGGDTYYIQVVKCQNPDVNKEYYYGPPIYSAGLPDGIQPGKRSWSMFLRPTLCPDQARRAQPREEFVFLLDALSKEAICGNPDCPFHSDYVEPPIKQPSTLMRIVRRVLDGEWPTLT